MTGSTAHPAWHRAWFDEDYLRLYGHRDVVEARLLLAALRREGLLPGPAEAGSVLDLGCGAGRHSLELARQGYQVAGLDWSPPLLRKALDARPGGPPPAFARADLGRLPLRPGAGVVLSLFTSLGYLAEDEANLAVWRRLLELPRPGGRLVLDYLNPAWVRATLVPAGRRQVGGWVVEERRRVDESRGTVVKHLRFGPPGEPPREVCEEVKLYGPDWFLAQAPEAGCELLAHWGDLEGGPFRPDSPRSLLVLELRP